MKVNPHSLKTVHFIGIGGIGMSGIAEVLHNLGFTVQGSDKVENSNTKRLIDLGVKVFIGHHAHHLDKAQVVVVSSSIKGTNPELITARERRIPVVKRAEMLAELMHLKYAIAISGTHGKTTTTSLIAALLDAANMDPTVINGGIINAYGTNARLGEGEWVVVEADESDGTFIKLPATIAIVTNIDPEHMDYYGDFESLKDAFRKFVDQLPFYGLGILCWDHPVVRTLAESITDRRVVTYGLEEGSHIRGANIQSSTNGMRFDVEIFEGQQTYASSLKRPSVIPLPKKIKDLFIPMMGNHNVQNALTLVAIARELGLGEEIVRQALIQFKGVKRRFTKVGEVEGVTIIDDYAHHPEEIRKVIEAAQQACHGRVILVMQPHRYTRLSHLFDEFVRCCEKANYIIMTTVYSAGEEPIKGATSEHLVEELQRKKQNVSFAKDQNELVSCLISIIQPNDYVICAGAGSITHWAAALPTQLNTLLIKHGPCNCK